MSEPSPAASSPDATPLSHPPRAEQRPTARTFHGDTVSDPYEWLREKDSPETRAYLEAENAWTKQETAHLDGLRGAIFDEIKSRTLQTDLSVPSRAGSYWYYARAFEGKQYPATCRCPIEHDNDWTPPVLAPDAMIPGEQVLVDGNELGEGQAYYSLGTVAVSQDERFLAYSTDTVGDERYTVYVKDLTTGELLGDQIPNTLHDVVWSNDGRHLFYVTVDDTWRPDRVWRHELGADVADDALVYHEPDEHYWTSIRRTTSDRFLIIDSGSKVTSESRVIDADDATGEFRVVIARQDGVEYSLEHAIIGGDDAWVVTHNRDAINFEVATGPLDASSLDELTVLIGHSDDVRLAGVAASSTHLVVSLREHGLPQVRVIDLGTPEPGPGTNLAFDEPMYDVAPLGFSDWHQPYVRFVYGSWLTPDQIVELDPSTNERHLRKERPVLGGYDPSQFTQSRLWVTARDGAEVPVSIVHHRDVEPRSNAPMLLYGYGSYEASFDPLMRIPALSLMERGIVFALTHIRGGGEMGRLWYENGKGLAKKNTFNDYVDTARHLIEDGWTSPDRLIAQGGSAGGLLMGAVVNAAPELFAGVVAQVPFVDALTSILMPELPLTVIEWDEWGDPYHDPEVYAYMKSYSPYENVADGVAYPPIFAITSINDTRVLYVEPAKWVARLRDAVPDSSRILFKCEMSAGHGGASGRYDAWKETAEYYAWAIDTVGASHEPRHAIG